ncbi:class I SAM-dependent methyltransferase [Candidatus Peregrinibacteria bacterium]|nr:class I SAM-dependent methyltransferase [Candidatus Peregrinibacteria bacterium]
MEKKYWLDHKERICSQEWLSHVRKRTDWFLNWYKNYGTLTEKSTILHIGSGAEGEINFIEIGSRFAIDPLADFYKIHFGHILNKQVTLLKGKGENLPFADNSFDLVIAFNSLDHTESPSQVLSEIVRVLKKGGILYIGVHVRSNYGHLLFEISKKVRTINDHYHSYTRDSLKKHVERFPFVIVNTKDETRLEKTATSRKEVRESNAKRLLRFLTGQNEQVYHLLARKL